MIERCACGLLVCLAGLVPAGLGAQALPSPGASQSSAGPTATSFQGSLVTGEASGQAIDLSLDEAIQRGLKTNLGIILSGTQTASAKGGQRLSQLQSLLPSVECQRQGNR